MLVSLEFGLHYVFSYKKSAYEIEIWSKLADTIEFCWKEPNLIDSKSNPGVQNADKKEKVDSPWRCGSSIETEEGYDSRLEVILASNVQFVLKCCEIQQIERKNNHRFKAGGIKIRLNNKWHYKSITHPSNNHQWHWWRNWKKQTASSL